MLVTSAVPVAAWEFWNFSRRFIFTVPAQMNAEAEAEAARLRSELRAAEAKLAGRRRNQQIADALTERHAYAIKHLVHRPIETEQDLKAFEVDEAAFTTDLIQRMKSLGCTTQDVHAVENIGLFPVVPLHKHYPASAAKGMLVFRLDRLAEVATSYAQQGTHEPMQPASGNSTSE